MVNEMMVVEYNGVRVLTTQQIAEAYGASSDVITRNYNRNKERYRDGKHYIALEGDEKNDFVDRGQFDRGLKNAKVLYLWTETGALLHAKSLNTDVAWDVYERLVDEYFRNTKAKQLSERDIMRIQLGMIDDHEDRITNLENNMTLDYGQQKVLGDTVNKTVIDVLGGKDSNAYRKIGKKVFAECNRDLKTYFNVNARNNVPKKRYEEAIEYAKNWKPCTNTMMMICNYNAQQRLAV